MSIVEKNIDILFDRIAALEAQTRAIPRSVNYGSEIETLNQKVESLKSQLLDEQTRSAASLGQVKQTAASAVSTEYFKAQLRQLTEALVKEILTNDRKVDATIGVAAKDAEAARDAAQSITKAAATQLVSEIDRLCRGGIQ